VTLANQGLVSPAPLAIAATFAQDGMSVQFTVPDGVTTETLTITAADGTQATCQLIVASQYLQAAQYAANGDGADDAIASLGPGMLDNVLRNASSFIDARVGNGGLRLLQVQEDHEYQPSRMRLATRGPRVYPLRGPMRAIPIVSLDALSFMSSSAFYTDFAVTGNGANVYVNKTAGYFEVQPAAVGTAMLLAEAQTFSISANVWKVTYTSGFGWAQTPYEVREATAITATELLIYRGIIQRGLGGLSRIREGSAQYDRRFEPFAVPQPALDLLAKWMGASIR
jgi:hypothetical protein